MSDAVEFQYVCWGIFEGVADRDMYKASKVVDGTRLFPYIEVNGEKVYLAVNTVKNIYL